MKTSYKRESAEPTAEETKELEGLASRPIDTSDVPEQLDWSGAGRGKFYRPVKQAVSLRLDADVLAWLKKDGQGYQTRVNQMLRERMLEELRQQ